MESYLHLTATAPELPWVPVLQGWEMDDYFDHLEQYAKAGVRLAELPLVGLGSICRRQGTKMAEELVRGLWMCGVKLHGFGFKILGLQKVAPFMESADSMAWSYQARKREPLPGCKHLSCANCFRYATKWRESVLSEIEIAEAEYQLPLY